MWEMLVLGYVLAIGGSFVGAEVFPRARKFLTTVGVLVTVVPLLLLAALVIFVASTFHPQNLHFG
jgi:hypothetical protein